jgi:hypothetical protein
MDVSILYMISPDSYSTAIFGVQLFLEVSGLKSERRRNEMSSDSKSMNESFPWKKVERFNI